MINYTRRTRPSARVLERRLFALGYHGRPINFGGKVVGAINSPEATSLAEHKKRALYTMRDAGVPVPALYTPQEALTAGVTLVGRKNYHRQGKELYICPDRFAVEQAINRGATHFMEYIRDAQEFRVQTVNGLSIKISEKIGGGNYHAGARFTYPHSFNHKKTLRRVSCEAVSSLGLDFGAVDVLYKDGQFYVLEVNTCPALTCGRSTTLDKFAEALVNNYG